MADGYGAGLFDSKGPKDFATAVGGIASELSTVQGAFTTFGTLAKESLSGVAGAVNDLIGKLTEAKSALQGVQAPGGGGGGGGMGQPRLWLPTSAGGGSGNTGSNLNAQGWSKDAVNDQPNAQTGDSGTTSQPSGLGARVRSWFRGQDTGSTTQATTKQGTTQTDGGGGGGMPIGTASTMGQRAVQSMIPAAVGGVMGIAQNAISTAVQGATIGQMEAPAFGVSSRSLYVIPGGVLAQNPQDYAQSNYYAMMNMGVGPGGAPGSLRGQNWSTVQRGANQLMTLLPGMQRQQAMAVQNQMMQPGNLNAGLMFGFNFSPGGRLMTPQQQYEQIFNRLSQGVGGKPTADQIAEWTRPGGPWQQNLQQLGIDPGSEEYMGFMQYAMTRIGQTKQGKGMPDVGTTKGAKQTPLGNTPAYAQLQAQTAKSQLQSQAEPALAQAAKSLNEAAGKLLQFANPLAKVLGSTGAGAVVGGIAKTLLGSQLGGLVTGLMGHIPGLQGGGIVHRPTLAMVGEAGPEAVVPLGRGNTGPGGTGAAGGDGGVLAALSGKPPPNSLLDLLTRPVKGAGGMAGPGANPVVALLGALGLGGVGGGVATPRGTATVSTGGTGGAGAPATIAPAVAPIAPQGASPYAWNYRAGGGGAPDMSSMFAPSQSSSNNGGSGGSGGNGGATSGGATAPTSLTGSGNVQQAYNFFLSKGLKDYQAAGILGNLAQESGVDPKSNQSGGGPGRGIAQWTVTDRWQGVIALAKSQNKQPTDLSVQLDYMWQELNTSEKASLVALQGTKNVTDATTIFQQDYERAGTPNMGNRLKYAQNVLTSKGAGYARGTQLIDRNQLALLHRGESVIPAADNYSAGPVYNRNGASNGGAPVVHLNFKSGSIVLQVPPTSSQQDMETLANQFVAAISKPTILAGVRSR